MGLLEQAHGQLSSEGLDDGIRRFGRAIVDDQDLDLLGRQSLPCQFREGTTQEEAAEGRDDDADSHWIWSRCSLWLASNPLTATDPDP